MAGENDLTNKITQNLNIFDNNQEQARNKVSMQLSMPFWCARFSEGFFWVIFPRFPTIISCATTCCSLKTA